MTTEIRSLDNEYVLEVFLVELEDYYVEKVTVSPLVLHTSQYYIENQEGIQIDVSHDFRRAVFPGERAVVQGTRLDILPSFHTRETRFSGQFGLLHSA